MTSFWEMQAELRQQELLEDAQSRRIALAPRRRRHGGIVSLTLSRIRRARTR